MKIPAAAVSKVPGGLSEAAVKAIPGEKPLPAASAAALPT